MLTAYQVVQIAVAVFLGNLMTLAIFKGYQRMKREDRFEWVTAFYYLSPLAATLVVMLFSS